VRRFSTSAGVAPGRALKTSTIGTLICGSSSRGSIKIENTPSRIDARTTMGVSFDVAKTAAKRPARP